MPDCYLVIVINRITCCVSFAFKPFAHCDFPLESQRSGDSVSVRNQMSAFSVFSFRVFGAFYFLNALARQTRKRECRR